MGIKDRMRANITEAVVKVTGVSDPELVVMASRVGKTTFFHWLAPIAQAFKDKPVYLAVVGDNLVMIKPALTKMTGDIVFNQQLSEFDVEAFKEGFGARLELRRTNGEEYRLAFSRMWKPEARELRERLR